MSSSVKLYPPDRKSDTGASNPLPELLKTPAGLAILELQGIVNLPLGVDGEPVPDVEVGRIDFPDYDASAADGGGSDWMKRVHLYVGQHQRLTGEVKKLPKAIAVVRRRENRVKQGSGGSYEEQGENLEVVEVVKYKLMFSNRPEPVNTEKAL
ncbi:chromosome transmission fidelity 8 [Paramyrothecium foliicola]|nr:chromosome transmission fidelity 8 [Paramyrothecium foliicola]